MDNQDKLILPPTEEFYKRAMDHSAEIKKSRDLVKETIKRAEETSLALDAEEEKMKLRFSSKPYRSPFWQRHPYILGSMIGCPTGFFAVLFIKWLIGVYGG